MNTDNRTYRYKKEYRCDSVGSIILGIIQVIAAIFIAAVMFVILSDSNRSMTDMLIIINFLFLVLNLGLGVMSLRKGIGYNTFRVYDDELSENEKLKRILTSGNIGD